METAIKVNPEDSKAYYYLGNAYYDKKRYKEAMKLWETSVNLNPEFATANRNLALAYVNIKGDLDQGLKFLQKAYECNTKDARVLFELDQLYKKVGKAHDERRNYLEKREHIVEERDDLYIEYLTLLNSTGKYLEAKKLIDNRIFNPWEGKLQGTAENDCHYFLGLAYEGLGLDGEANTYFLKASIGIDKPTDAMFYNDQPADMMFYRGLSPRIP